ncbi:MAG: aldehyde dehydrogenase family protein, partial [Pseudomonadota bacterium]
ALRVLYVQEDVADTVVSMLKGAMDELNVGDPWDISTDVGPVIDTPSRSRILNHIRDAEEQGRLMHRISCPESGTFVAPVLISVDSILDLGEEIFGPVLHVAMFAADQIDQVIADINQTGYGLTFGLHTRIDDRVQHLVDNIEAGNIYVNRNQIGAIVGSQPFGGEGLSGTGPKAGGPNYLPRFTGTTEPADGDTADVAFSLGMDEVQKRIDEASREFHPKRYDRQDLPGPTGESNTLSRFPRGVVLCFGPSQRDLELQTEIANEYGCNPVLCCSNQNGFQASLDPSELSRLTGFDAVLCFSNVQYLRKLRIALAGKDGPILPLLTGPETAWMLLQERHVCVDTTASGGNTSLLAAQFEG